MKKLKNARILKLKSYKIYYNIKLDILGIKFNSLFLTNHDPYMYYSVSDVCNFKSIKKDLFYIGTL